MTKPLNAISSLLNSSLQMLIFIYQKNCKIINLMSIVEKYNLLNRCQHGIFQCILSSAENNSGASAVSYSLVLITTGKLYRVLNVFQCTTSISYSPLTSVSMSQESRTLNIQLNSLSQEIQMADGLHAQTSLGQRFSPIIFSLQTRYLSNK